MLNTVTWFVGLRYLRAKGRTKFVSFITLISLLGVALGVAALIVILSVMNGFEDELRERLLSMTAHGYVTGPDRRLEDWQAVRQRVSEHEGVLAAAPVIEMEGMIRTGHSLTAVRVNGVLPQYEQHVSGRTINFLEGSLGVLKPGAHSIVIGRLLALDLGVRPGDGVLLLIPRPGGDGTLQPVLQRFVLRGLFEAGVQDHDSALALVNLEDAAQLTESGDSVTAVRFLGADVMAAPEIARSLRDELGEGFRSSDWTIDNASYFHAIRIEKMMMSLILSLIIGVAAFNIVASLVMVVTDKTIDIAIFRTLGMAPGDVVRVFFIQGAMIGWIGVLAGVLCGVIIAVNVPALVPAIEHFFGFQIMPGDVYYVTSIPSDVELEDVMGIALAAFALTSIATLYPARRAAKVDPAVALRYE